MKTIQITLIDELHQNAKALALANRETLKQFMTEAIKAHVATTAARAPVTRSVAQEHAK